LGQLKKGVKRKRRRRLAGGKRREVRRARTLQGQKGAKRHKGAMRRQAAFV